MRWEFSKAIQAERRKMIIARLKEMRAGRKLSKGQLEDFCDYFGYLPKEELEYKARIAVYLLTFNQN
jgi:hypothetical protein